MLEYLLGILIGMAIVNFASFVFMRPRWRANGRLGGELVPHIGDPNSKLMDYVVAGNANQGWAAFGFMRSKLHSNYTYVNYSTVGWEVTTMVEKIATDIKEHNYKARIFTISVGDHVARYLENDGSLDVTAYAINPCPNCWSVKWYLMVLLFVFAPIFCLICYGLGWLSIIPFIPTVGGKYSLMLLADQYLTIVYDLPPNATTKTAGIVLSKNDQLLNNDAIKQTFSKLKPEYVDAAHGDTVGAGSEYLRAVEKLLNN